MAICIRYVSFLAAVVIVAAPLTPTSAAPQDLSSRQVVKPVRPDNVVLQWNNALLEAVRQTNFRPMWTARALAIVHTAMYDAWAAYDRRAVGVHWNQNLRRPRRERTDENRQVATSFAAYRALVDLFPSEVARTFDPLMARLGLDPQDDLLDPSTPSGIGNVAAAEVIAFRHRDGSNQLGDLNGGAPYSDYTGYVPVNSPDQIIDPNRWQPLRGPTGIIQTYLAPHWGLVTPFALTSPDQFRPEEPALFPDPRYHQQAEAIRRLSARLTDRDKVIAEYWADGPSTETPPGHWSLLAQHVSRRDRHGMDDDVRMFFVLGNALLDASIAVWECKVAYDYVRPITALHFIYGETLIEAWAGPFQGTRLIRGKDFRSYIATPPFAEYTSGHSAFSSASAEVLTLFTGSPWFGASHTFKAGASSIEPNAVPRKDITLTWPTFVAAADQAGLSRRLGGIHFRQGDVESRRMGKRIGWQAWRKAQRYFDGVAR
jgi:hypothetical protein